MPPKPSFEKALSKLIQHLQRDPDDAAKTLRLLRATRRSVVRQDVSVQAGLELEDTLSDPGVHGRMHARGVDAINVRAGAPEEDLLALARALAVDEGDLPTTDLVGVQMVIAITPGEMPAPPVEPSVAEFLPPIEGTSGGSRPPRLAVGPEQAISQLAAAIKGAAERGAWTDALHAAQALSHVTQQAPDETKRQVGIAARRVLSARLLRGFIDHAIRVQEERDRTGAVLEWAGRAAAEVVVDTLKETESIGPKQFLFELVGRMPDVYPLVEPLLQSPNWHEVRLGAFIMGELKDDNGVPFLIRQQRHADARVRVAVVDALGRYQSAATLESIMESLSDSSPEVRVAAADALGARSAVGGMVMVLAAALGKESDQDVRLALVDALGRIHSSEAATALATVSLSRRSLLNRRGYTLETRLASVVALADNSSRGAVTALERVASDARGEVAQAARRVLAQRDTDEPTPDAGG